MLVFCDSQLLVRAGTLEPAADLPTLDLLRQTRATLDEFVVRPQGHTAVALSGTTDAAPPGGEWVRLRQLLAAGTPGAGLASRALGLLNWRAARRFCGVCGGAVQEHPVEMALRCPACGHTEYPCLFPAVIVRIEKQGRLLLARHVQRPTAFYSCLAGYIEAGESAEEAVHREVREEAGIEIRDVRYAGSQHWPYPNQLMLAFRAVWSSGDLCLQASEIAEAGWFDPADLPAIPPPGSVAHRLIHLEAAP